MWDISGDGFNLPTMSLCPNCLILLFRRTVGYEMKAVKYDKSSN